MAIFALRIVETFQPNFVKAKEVLGQLLVEKGRKSEAVTAYSRAIEIDPIQASYHKALINVLAEEEKWEEIFRIYGLERKDSNGLQLNVTDYICCVAVRNESLRLPYFLSYYREKGITKFFMVDNNSTDETLNFLLEQPDVYTWQSNLPFNKANFGSCWFEVLLRKYGQHHWCLIVDADELFYYPDCEKKTIPQLCSELDIEKKKAFQAILLDMYSKKPIKDTQYTPRQTFLNVCGFFDICFYHRKRENGGPFKNLTFLWGGMRTRVFGDERYSLLTKVPLIKYTSDVLLAGGQHWTNYQEKDICSQTGALLHFKYFSTFPNYVKQEVELKQHSNWAKQYVQYEKALRTNENLTLFSKDHSIPFENSEQLIRLGIMQREQKTENHYLQWGKLNIPFIPPVISKMKRPFWSVMITVYDRVEFLSQALNSVLAQDPGIRDMQIEVINDGGAPEIQVKIENIVNQIGGDRITLYRHPSNIGHPGIFNICIQRARGYWVHVLHDDDFVETGFYTALRAGIETDASVGAAFCRSIFIKGPHAISGGTTLIERGNPGVIDNWLERIAIRCRLQMPSIVVKREVYEQLGGFSSMVGSTFDWEMWMRIAVSYPFWFEPQPLAYSRKHSRSESALIKRSGAQVADSLKCIGITKSYLPKTTANSLSRSAKELCVRKALTLAKRQLKVRDFKAAIRNIRESLRCCL